MLPAEVIEGFVRSIVPGVHANVAVVTTVGKGLMVAVAGLVTAQPVAVMVPLI